MPPVPRDIPESHSTLSFRHSGSESFVRTCLLLIGGLVVGSLAGAADVLPLRAPVVVELFTSEGCSSCPPADLVLEKLDRQQPVPGAQIIVLSEHVDYWDHIGWKDPYSSAAFSRRQEEYVQRFGLDGAYTPQMVVDGRTQFVGSDWQRAYAAIQDAAGQHKATVRIAAIPGGLRVEVDPLPGSMGRNAGVFLARADDSGASDVTGGENKGRRLRHVAIAKEIERIGTVSAGHAFARDLKWGGTNGMRMIALVQATAGGPILGSAILTPASRDPK